MRKNMKLFLVPALLLMLAVLAGCSQADDALPDGTAVARGGEPLNIRIAPKPGYTESINTRATVNDDTGAFAWENGDHIIVLITFNDAAATTVRHWGTYHSGSTASYIPDWDMVELRDNLIGSPIAKLAWPLGASSATVTVAHANSLPHEYEASGYPSYESGEDCMWFEKNIALGEDLTIDLAHLGTRLVFTGLVPNIQYRLLGVDGKDVLVVTYFRFENLAPSISSGFYFTSDANGNLTVCTDLDGKIDANGKLKLKLVKNGETTPVYQTTLTAQGTAGAYKMNGYNYKIKVAGGGTVNPDNYSDLMSPTPILPDRYAVEINGYWVVMPHTNLVSWATDPSATVMENDPCAGHGDWRLPTMKDFEKMAGWTETWPWSETVGSDQKEVLNVEAWNNSYGFGQGGGQYLSSTVSSTDPTKVWTLVYPGSGSAYYALIDKTTNVSVRCVQPK